MLLEQEIDADNRPQTAAAKRSRRCIVTGESLPCENLVRFVVGPDRNLVPDIAGKLPGRGLWLGAGRDIVDRACAGNLIAKAARAPVRVPPDLAQQVEDLLVRRCLELLGLARRAGQAVAGFEKVRNMLSRDRAGVLLSAADGAQGGRNKLGVTRPGVARIDLLERAELGGVFGREMTVHASVAKGNLADKLVAEAVRLAGFRTRIEPGKLCRYD